MLDMFAMLDALKNMKACLNNDFSFCKRANSFLTSLRGTGAANPDDMMAEREIAVFLASQNSITQKLQKDLQSIERYDEVLVEILNECLTMYENKIYLLPTDKHMFLKVRIH